jgi:DNA-binding NtrC family response regulator
MSPAVQAKLLRALEERAFERVGGLQKIRVDMRVVAATNRDLSRAIADGKFREDLFYRLAVVTVEAPPLRERAGDLPLLCELFLAEKAAELGLPPRRLQPAALEALSRYDFPGNVRELENLIERAMVFAEGELIGAEDLPLHEAARPAANLEALLGGNLSGGWNRLAVLTRDLERLLLLRAIEKWPDRPNEEIARLLGTSRRVLELRLAAHGIKKR